MPDQETLDDRSASKPTSHWSKFLLDFGVIASWILLGLFLLWLINASWATYALLAVGMVIAIVAIAVGLALLVATAIQDSPLLRDGLRALLTSLLDSLRPQHRPSLSSSPARGAVPRAAAAAFAVAGLTTGAGALMISEHVEREYIAQTKTLNQEFQNLIRETTVVHERVRDSQESYGVYQLLQEKSVIERVQGREGDVVVFVPKANAALPTRQVVNVKVPDNGQMVAALRDQIASSDENFARALSESAIAVDRALVRAKCVDGAIEGYRQEIEDHRAFSSRVKRLLGMEDTERPDLDVRLAACEVASAPIDVQRGDRQEGVAGTGATHADVSAGPN